MNDPRALSQIAVMYIPSEHRYYSGSYARLFCIARPVEAIVFM